MYRTVARVDEIPEGEGRGFIIDDKPVAVFNDGGQFYAIRDQCPHAGAPLSCGSLIQGSVVCAWHAWRFRLSDGAWVENTRLQIPCYPVRVEGNEVQVRLEDDE